MAKYSVDYEEAKRGEDILRGVLGTICNEVEDYVYGNQNYGEMLYKIGEKLAVAGCALYSENKYSDKDTNSDKWYGQGQDLADFDKFADALLEQMGQA